MTLENDHQHPNGIRIEDGKLKVAGKHLEFVKGLLYKDQSTQEQRLCLTLIETPNPRLVKSATKPFADVDLNESILVGNLPISHLKVVLLSASGKGNQIDVVISPSIEKLDPILHPKRN